MSLGQEQHETITADDLPITDSQEDCGLVSASVSQQSKPRRFKRAGPLSASHEAPAIGRYRHKKFARDRCYFSLSAAKKQLDRPQDNTNIKAQDAHQPQNPTTVSKKESLADTAEVDSDSILRVLGGKEYANYVVLEEGIDELVKKSRQPPGDSVEVVQVKVAQCLDATAAISVDDAGMEAVLTITAASTGKAISREDVASIMEKTGISFGIKEARIEALINAARIADQGTLVSDIITFGQPCVNGTDTEFKPLIGAPDRSQQTNSEGVTKLNWRDRGDIMTVGPDDKLMCRVAPTRGEDGVTVCGETVEATPGLDIAFELGDGVKISSDDPSILVATTTGQPIVIPNGMMVEPILRLQHVDMASGNIVFDGTVVVEGSVKEGMEVEATGDIVVGDMVESAILKAGRNIAVNNGIIGHQSSKHADRHGNYDYSFLGTKMHAKCAIDAGFVQFAELKAEQDICVQKVLLHSLVSSNASVIVGGERASDGKLIGGEIQALGRVEANDLGSDAFIKTLIRFPADTIALHTKEEQLIKEKQSKVQIVERLEQLRSRHVYATKTPQTLATIERITATMEQVNSEVESLEEEHDKIRAERKQLKQASRVVVHKALYPRIRITIANKTFVVGRQLGKGIVEWRDNKIDFFASN